MIKVRCPQCGTWGQITPEEARGVVQCHACAAQFEAQAAAAPGGAHPAGRAVDGERRGCMSGVAATAVIGVALLGVLVVCGGILAAILLPALAKARESARRAACVNNLKQLSLVLNLYANENQDAFPLLDDRPGNLMFDGSVLYPEYLSDVGVLGCLSDARYDPDETFRLARVSAWHAGLSVGDPHPDCIEAVSYVYVGHAILSDSDLAAYESAPTPSEASGAVPRLSSSVADTLGVDPGAIPVMWDRGETDLSHVAHIPAGLNVAFLDGHVEFQRVSPASSTFPSSKAGLAFMERHVPAASGNPADPWGDCP